VKAATYSRNGGPEVFTYENVADPDCPPGWVLVRMAAVSIEGGDLLARSNEVPPRPAFVVGYAAAGEVVEVGDGVDTFTVGQTVATLWLDGSHAELRSVPAELAYLVPDGLDIAAAASVPVGWATADEGLFARAGLQVGETVLVQGGAGGVGVAATQLAKRAGATVIATASSDDRLERLADLGVDYGINYRDVEVSSAVLELTGGRGVDLVLDTLGSTVASSIAACAPGGRVALVGDAGRATMTADMRNVLMGNRTVHGIQMAPDTFTVRRRAQIERLLGRLARGELEPVIDRRFPLSEAASAHKYIESRNAVGRVVLEP
jgi:NADPH2:quinone reductase